MREEQGSKEEARSGGPSLCAIVVYLQCRPLWHAYPTDEKVSIAKAKLLGGSFRELLEVPTVALPSAALACAGSRYALSINPAVLPSHLSLFLLPNVY